MENEIIETKDADGVITRYDPNGRLTILHPDGRIEWTTFDENGKSKYCGVDHSLKNKREEPKHCLPEDCEDFMKLMEEV